MPENRPWSRRAYVTGDNRTHNTLTLRGNMGARCRGQRLVVLNDLPYPLAVTSAELDLLEAHLSDLISEMVTGPD